MSLFSSLPPAEHARQLANPEGPVGVAVAEWLNGNNREGHARVFAMLQLQPGCRVLEIGFGNRRAAPEVIAGAENVRYVWLAVARLGRRVTLREALKCWHIVPIASRKKPE